MAEVLALLAIAGVAYLWFENKGLKAEQAKLVDRFDALLEHLRGMSGMGDGSAGVATTTQVSPESSTPRDAVTSQSGEAAQEGPWKKSDTRKKMLEHFGPPKPPPPPPPPREPSAFEKLGPWLIENWFYAVSALSLALAGIFLVQYGMENGLLPPLARVVAALGFGAVLIGVGEVIRRKFGDHKDATTAYLPSVFSGAGIVTLFGGILSARLLYDLIGPATSLIGMVAVALVAMVLGWFYGPLLAAVGLLGAFGAPYVVGVESNDATWFFGYFAVLSVMGLGIDTIKRWTWVSVLTLVLAYASGALLGLNDRSVSLAFVMYLTLLPLLAMTIPQRTIMPNHDGHMISDIARLGQTLRVPYIPVQLFGGAMVASVVLLLAVTRGEAEVWLILVCLLVLIFAISLWGRKAAAIQDIAAVPVAGVLAHVALIAIEYRKPVFVKFRDTYTDTLEADFPFTVTLFLVIGAGLSLLAAWRSQDKGRLRLPFSFAAILIAPLMGIILEMFWRPAEIIGAPTWALHAVVLAGLMVWFAASFAKADGGPGLRTALAVLAALSIIAYALSIVLTYAALTVGLSAMIVVAAWLDRKWSLPQMSWFVISGVAVIGYRLLADPGLVWGFEDAGLLEALFSYGGALGAAIAAYFVLKPLERPDTRVVLEAGIGLYAALLACLLLYRGLETLLGSRADGHWMVGLFASVWLAAAISQIYSMGRSPALKILRWIVAGIFALVAVGFLALLMTFENPFMSSLSTDKVIGPAVINTLIPAFLLPALTLALGAWVLKNAPRPLRLILAVLGVAMGVFWLFLTIRHFWSADGRIDVMRGMDQGELYTYTVVLLITGAILFYQSLAKNRILMRRAGLVVIGAAVAKVFLIDISGLEGLTRVFSLLILGLSLAGLAWLNRWAQMQAEPPKAQAPEQPPDPEEPLDPEK